MHMLMETIRKNRTVIAVIMAVTVLGGVFFGYKTSVITEEDAKTIETYVVQSDSYEKSLSDARQAYDSRKEKVRSQQEQINLLDLLPPGEEATIDAKLTVYEALTKEYSDFYWAEDALFHAMKDKMIFERGNRPFALKKAELGSVRFMLRGGLIGLAVGIMICLTFLFIKHGKDYGKSQ